MASEPYLQLAQFEFFGRQWVLARTGDDLGIILPHFADGRRMAIRQVRPDLDARIVGPPMGTFEIGPPNDLLPLARGETRSETGHDVLAMAFAFSVYRSPGLTNQRAHVYVSIVHDRASGQLLHADEDIEVVIIPRDATYDDVLREYSDDYVDAALAYYFLPGILSYLDRRGPC